jgi:hypothetical protein
LRRSRTRQLSQRRQCLQHTPTSAHSDGWGGGASIAEAHTATACVFQQACNKQQGQPHHTETTCDVQPGHTALRLHSQSTIAARRRHRIQHQHPQSSNPGAHSVRVLCHCWRRVCCPLLLLKLLLLLLLAAMATLVASVRPQLHNVVVCSQHTRQVRRQAQRVSRCALLTCQQLPCVCGQAAGRATERTPPAARSTHRGRGCRWSWQCPARQSAPLRRRQTAAQPRCPPLPAAHARPRCRPRPRTGRSGRSLRVQLHGRMQRWVQLCPALTAASRDGRARCTHPCGGVRRSRRRAVRRRRRRRPLP